MNRRHFLATAAGTPFAEVQIPFHFPQITKPVENQRECVLVRSGFTRKPDGTDERAPSPSGMFDTEVVRSSDSEGRLAIFLFPTGDHHSYAGAPLHVHHQQDEW